MHNFSFFAYPQPGDDVGALPAEPRPSDTIPLLSLEVAAQEEAFLLRRDAQIACCFGFKVSRMTALRLSPEPATRLHWELLERRWLTEGPQIQVATEKRRAAFAKARAERLRRETKKLSEAAERLEAQALLEAQEAGAAPLPWFFRATLLLLDFSAWLLTTLSSARVILPVAGCVLAYLLLDALIPGFWESLLVEARTLLESSLTGVTP